MGQGAAVGHRRLDGPQCGDRGRRRHKTEKAACVDAALARRRQAGARVGYSGLADHSQRNGVMTLKKRSLSLSGHRTSVALEIEFWAVIDACAAREGVSLAALVAKIDATRAA